LGGNPQRAAGDGIPYPAVHVSQEEAKLITGRLFERGLAGGGIGEKFVGVADQIGREIERKTDEFAEMYKNWWDRHSENLRRRANELQDALMSAARSPEGSGAVVGATVTIWAGSVIPRCGRRRAHGSRATPRSCR
jgi:hypothetical protein